AAGQMDWDQSILAVELQHLITVDNHFDVTITGFEIPEIDLILSQKAEEPDRDHVFEFDQTVQTVTRPGDLWLLGKHHVLCGSSLEEASYETLMGKRRGSVVFVYQTYTVQIDGKLCGKGSVHHREFAMACGEMTEPEFLTF